MELSLEQKVDQLLIKVDKIDTVLCGDSKYNALGLIERQLEDERRLKDLEKRVGAIEVNNSDKKIKHDTVLRTLKIVLYVMWIGLTGFLIYKGALDLAKLIDIVK